MADNQKPSQNPNDVISFGDFFPQEQSVPMETQEDSENQSSQKGKGRLRQELEDRGKEKIKKYAKEKLGIGEKEEGGVEKQTKPLSDKTQPLSQNNGKLETAAEDLANVGEKLGIKTTGREILEEGTGKVAKNIVIKEGVQKAGEQATQQIVKQGGKLATQLGGKIATTAGSAAAESATGVGAVVAVVQVAAAIGDIAVMPLQQLAKGEYSKIDESEMVLWGLLSLFMSLLSIVGAFFFLIAFDIWLAHAKGSDKSFGITRFLVQVLIGSIPIIGLPFCVLGWSVPQHNKTSIGISPSKKSEEQKNPAQPKTPKK